MVSSLNTPPQLVSTWRDANTTDRAQKFMTRQIVLYVHLWVIEGAIRKWVPGTENAMYFARDALIILGLAYTGLFMGGKLRRAPILWVIALGLTSFVAVQLILGIVTLPVAAVGLRSYISPLLLVYAVWCYGRLDLSERIAHVVILYVPLQALIAVAQAVSSPQSWINKQVGSDSAYFVNGSVARASGTFSSPAGLTLYVPLAFAIILWILQSGRKKAKLPAMLCLASMIVIVVVSGSRGSVLATVIVLAAFLLFQTLSLSGRSLGSMLGIVAFTGLGLLWAITAFPEVVTSFVSRFENASASENSTDRIVGAIFDFSSEPFKFLGDGVGNHSIAGINLGGSGPWSEIESIRWVAELGVIGWLMGALRLFLCLGPVIYVIVALRKHSLLSILILAAAIPVILWGQITQFPSAQAFLSICVSMYVLTLLSMRRIDEL